MIFHKMLIVFLNLKNCLFNTSLAVPSVTKIPKVISISTGGFRGFTQLGICKYIKENYDLSDYAFSGASAGAWNSLFLSFKRDFPEFQEKVLDHTINNIKNIRELEILVKNKILTNFNTADFELDRLYVGVTTLHTFGSKVTIYSNFTDLEDAVDACVASSHIPYLTKNGFINMYRNTITFDGGFSKKPYLPNAVINITPDLWTKEKKEKKSILVFKISDYTTLFSRDQYSFNEMIEKGYYDSKQNKEYLDKIFTSKHDS
jgi:hypothetical protein